MVRCVFRLVCATALAALLVGCSDGGEGGGGNSAAPGGTAGSSGTAGNGVIGPLTWKSSHPTIAGTDACEYFDENQILTAVITIDGSVVTLDWLYFDYPSFSTDDYDPSDDDVTLTSEWWNVASDPCHVLFTDAIWIQFDDTSRSLDQNDTLAVTWDHAEEELSVNACHEYPWWDSLPCSATVFLTLTRQP